MNFIANKVLRLRYTFLLKTLDKVLDILYSLKEIETSNSPIFTLLDFKMVPVTRTRATEMIITRVIHAILNSVKGIC